MKWFFVLDHTHYSRWITVHLADLMSLVTTQPELYIKFMNGKFVLQKTQYEFSKITLDQLHEQNNATIRALG